MRLKKMPVKRYLSVSVAMAALFASHLAVGATAPTPAVRPVAPDGNLPLNSAMFAGSMDYGDLARYGYVEREFYFSGTASVRDQETGAVLKADLPYVSRLVVRMPLNPKSFSGNVIIEPFHGVLEKTDMWMQLHRYMTENGDAWVGFTVKPYSLDMEPTSGYALGGIPLLKAYDPTRYGSLVLEPDMRPLVKAPPAPTPPQAFDLMTQVAALLKGNGASSPLNGLEVKRLYALGSGINGEVIGGYVRTGQDAAWQLADGGQLIDGYMYGAVTRLPPSPPKNAAFVLFRSENEMDRGATMGFMGKNENTASYRVYDVPGTSHLGSRNLPSNGSTAKQMNGVLPKPDLNMPYALDSGGKCPNMNDDPVDLFLGAVLTRVEKWGKDGTPLPPAPEPELRAGDAGATMGNITGAGPDNPPLKVAYIKRDPISGNVVGGVRMPWVEAPVAQFVAVDPKMMGMGPIPGDIMHGGAAIAPGAAPPPKPMGPRPVIAPSDGWPRESKDDIQLPLKPGGMGFCFLFNPRLAYDSATLHELYKNYDDYVQKFDAAKAKAVKAGWLLQADADSMRPRGAPADFN